MKVTGLTGLHVRIIKGTCEGLKYLHHDHEPAHVLHLNLKPHNILLDYDMEPKLADFECSRFFDHDQPDDVISSSTIVTP